MTYIYVIVIVLFVIAWLCGLFENKPNEYTEEEIQEARDERSRAQGRARAIREQEYLKTKEDLKRKG